MRIRLLWSIAGLGRVGAGTGGGGGGRERRKTFLELTCQGRDPGLFISLPGGPILEFFASFRRERVGRELLAYDDRCTESQVATVAFKSAHKPVEILSLLRFAQHAAAA